MEVDAAVGLVEEEEMVSTEAAVNGETAPLAVNLILPSTPEQHGLERVEEALSDDELHIAEEQLSPSSLRRSTRTSALRAQERLRGDTRPPDADAEADGTTAPPADDADGVAEAPDAKRRRLAADEALDRSGAHFAVQMDDDGDVIVMSDDSEVSSLNDAEVQFVRKNYEKIVAQNLTEEQKRERLLMIRQLEAELRQEEAKLLILKKIRLSQQAPAKDFVAAGPDGFANGMSRPSNGAYRPPIAHPPKSVSSRATQPPSVQAVSKAPFSNNHGGRPQQLPAHQSRPQVPSSGGGSKPSHNQNRPPTSSHGGSQTASDNQTPAQRQAAAKLALRKQLEKTLLQIQPPKPPPPEMHFVPNPNQPDFVYLAGLDEAVQRVLRDKTQRSHRMPPPYCCSQCATDFTPVWKVVDDAATGQIRAICEQCVRTNEKKALKAEHTSRLKQAFVRALQQEQEIEQQIKEGKFNRPQTPPVSATPPVHAPPAVVSNKHHHHQHDVGAHSTPKAHASHHHHHHQHSSGAASSAASSSAAAAAAALQAAAVNQNPAMLAAAINPMGLLNPQILGMGWNPAVAARFPNLAMAALAHAAASNSSAGVNVPPNLQQSIPKDLLKNLQQQQSALQRQFFMDLLPKQPTPQSTHKWK